MLRPGCWLQTLTRLPLVGSAESALLRGAVSGAAQPREPGLAPAVDPARLQHGAPHHPGQQQHGHLHQQLSPAHLGPAVDTEAAATINPHLQSRLRPNRMQTLFKLFSVLY